MDSSPDTPNSVRSQSPVGSVHDFFKDVSANGFPSADKEQAKAQPWKELYTPQPPSADGKLIVACPKKADFGSNNLGGY